MWRRFASSLASALLLLLVPAAARATAVAGPAERLVLAVTLDGDAADEPIAVERRGATLWLRVADARALGLPVPPGATQVALDRVAGLRWKIDPATQTLVLDHVAPRRQRLSAGTAHDPAAVTARGWGGVLNYDLAATRAGDATAIGGFLDAIAYGPAGHAFVSAVVTAGGRGPGGRHFQRLDTGVTMADPRSLRRVTLGDLITGTTGQARAVRLGGVQWATDFALRPDLVTFPVPAIDAAAAVPSTVDLIVNGARAPVGDVRAGDFAVADAPVRTGANTLTVAVRDALGRETQRTLTTYASAALLRPGLVAWSLEAGLIRRGYATATDRYGAPAASASGRVGLTDRLTLEGHAEGAGRVGTASAGAAWSLGAIGLITVDGGVSGHGGGQYAVGFERIAHPVSFTARWQGTSRGWTDLAAANGAITRTHLATLSIGFDLAQLGSVGATLVDAGRGVVTRPRLATLPRSGLAALSWSRRLWRGADLAANVGADWRQRRSWFASAGILVALGGRTSGYAGITARPGGVGATAQLSSPALLPGETGWQAAAATGAIERLAGAVEHQGTRGRLEAAIEMVAGHVAARIGARGALVFADGAVVAADRQDDAFALVRTGRPGIDIYRDGNRVGRTDRRGRLVVGRLRPWERTRLSLDPLQLDDDARIDVAEQVAVPGERAGVPIRFAIVTAAARLLHLVREDGAAVPAGAAARVGGDPMPVGFDGALYLPGPLTSAQVTVALPDGTICIAHVPAGLAPATLACRAAVVIAHD